MTNLKYEKINNSNTAIFIDLHNDYSVMALSGYDMAKDIYTTTLLLKEERESFLLFIDTDEPFTVKATTKTIALEVLKLVSKLYDEGFFAKYIEEYEYCLQCFTLDELFAQSN